MIEFLNSHVTRETGASTATLVSQSPDPSLSI